MLRWVDWHTTILFGAEKWKTISLISPELLNHYLKYVSPTSEDVWRVAYGLGRSLGHVNNLHGHEALIIKLLSAASVPELSGNSLTYALMVLRDFASNLQARGRLVEAEGIFRHNIDCADCRKPLKLSSDNPYDYTEDRVYLVACLYSQGRRKEARDLFRVFKTQSDFNNDPATKDLLIEVPRVRRQRHRACLNTYSQALEIRKSGCEQYSIASSVAQLEYALNLYGCLENRLHEYGDPMFDIDANGIAFARSSKVLHLLDYTVVYLAFHDRSGKCDDLWARKDQGVLGQYFTWCECRRHRRRSGSLNPVELIERQFLRMSSNKCGKVISNKRQLSITKWLRHTLGDAEHSHDRDGLSGKELEALERRVIQEPDNKRACPEVDHCLSKFTPCKKGLDTTDFLTDKDPVELDPETGDLIWVPFFLQECDHELDLEHVAITNATTIPEIRITGAAGESPTPQSRCFNKRSVQMRITSYFSKLNEHFVGHPVSTELEEVQEE